MDDCDGCQNIHIEGFNLEKYMKNLTIERQNEIKDQLFELGQLISDKKLDLSIIFDEEIRQKFMNKD